MNFQEFSKTPNNDMGCALFYRDTSVGETKFHLLVPLEEIPALQGDYEEMEYGYTTSATVGKIKGRLNLESGSTDFYWVRDISNKLKNLKGKQLDLLVILPSYQGYMLKGEIGYKYNSITRGNLPTGTLTITPSWMSEEHIDDVKDFIQDTAFIETTIGADIEVPKTGGLTIDNIVTTPANATITVKYYSQKEYGGSEASTICTCTSAVGTADGSKKLTFTAPSGSSVGKVEIIELSVSSSGYATDKQYVRVTIV